MQLPFEDLLKALVSETYAKRNLVFAFFVVISLSLLAVGAVWPKRYTAFAIIHVDERNILQSLMQGTAEATKAVDHAANAREIIFGDRIMKQILKDAGWLKTELTDVEQERIKQQIKKNISVQSIGRDLLKIVYIDSNAQRAFVTAKRLGELFIKEGDTAKSKESQAAYDFINKQVVEYLKKLSEVESNLREFRSTHPDAMPGLETTVSARITRIQRDIEQAQLEIREAEIRRKSLDKQLSGEAALTISQSKEGQFQAKIAKFQEKLDRLRLDYTETYPDIVKLKHQIADLKQQMNEEVLKREESKKLAEESGDKFIDDAILLNPLYQKLRSDASSNETKIATLKARISEMNKMLSKEFEKIKRIHAGAAQLSKLTRDYDVNQKIYQELLQRRENARVSKSLDKERSGLTFEIQEPAKLPLIPTGLRFIHFALAGLVLGLAIPVGLIFVMLQVDPRIRFSQVISSELEIPVLAEFRRITSYSDLRKEKSNLYMLGLGFLVVFAIYGYVAWLKLTSSL